MHDKDLSAALKSAGYGSHVICRDSGRNPNGGRPRRRQYLTSDGTWTVNRGDAARCPGHEAAEELARKHGVQFYGRPDGEGVDMLCFVTPEQFDRWLSQTI
jgi:hypothetical protein